MKHQRGVAIIIVILIVALATSLSVYVLNQQSLWQRQVEAGFDRGQAKRLNLAGLDWARAILAEDGRNNHFDHEGELWAKRLPAMPVEGGEILGFIEDRQGRFNLNNLVLNGSSAPAYVAQFQRLLSMLGLPGELALNLADWLDSDNIPQPAGGAEDSYYLSLPKPYRCANRPLTEIGELSLVKGFDASIIRQLRPYVSVLPGPTAINVNFAPAEVLAAVIDLPLSEARAIVLQRRSNPFKSIEEFRLRLPSGSRNMSATDLSVSSQFFWVTGRTQVGNAQITAQALLQRTGTWPRILWQNMQ